MWLIGQRVKEEERYNKAQITQLKAKASEKSKRKENKNKNKNRNRNRKSITLLLYTLLAHFITIKGTEKEQSITKKGQEVKGKID